MEATIITTQLLTITLTFLTLASCSASATPRFILQSCKTTTYPSLCVRTLTPYASAVKSNPSKLCTTALAAAVQATRDCSAAASRLSKQKGLRRREARAIKECIGNLKDAVGELKQTVAAMGRLGGGDREFQWANAKTYGSAAITDADTCLDGILERKVNPVVSRKIRSCVVGVEKLMSNALALINHLY